jgi:hypothetical protein
MGLSPILCRQLCRALVRCSATVHAITCNICKDFIGRVKACIHGKIEIHDLQRPMQYCIARAKR